MIIDTALVLWQSLRSSFNGEHNDILGDWCLAGVHCGMRLE